MNGTEQTVTTTTTSTTEPKAAVFRPKSKASKANAKGAVNKGGAAKQANQRFAKQQQRKVNASVRKSAAKIGPQDACTTKLMQVIVLPKVAKALAIGTDFGTDELGATAPFEEPKCSFTQQDTNDPPNVTQIGDLQAFLFRSVLRNSILQYLPPYESTGLIQYGASMPTIPDGTGVNGTTPRQFAPTAFKSANGPGPLSPHGEYLFAGSNGKSDNRRGFWADYGAAITLQPGSPLTGLDSITITMYFWADGEWVSPSGGTVVLNAGTPFVTIRADNSHGFPIGPGNYIAYEFLEQGVANDLVILYQWTLDGPTNAVSVGYAHKTLTDFIDQYGNMAPLDEVGILGASLMFTNTSSLVAKQGQVAGLQIDANTDWTDFIGYDSVTTDNKKHRAFDNAEGMYGFLMPSHKDDFDYLGEFYRGVNHLGGTGPDGMARGFFVIQPEHPFLTMVVAAQSTQPRSGYWTIANSIQYLTNNQLFAIARPLASFKCYTDNISVVATATQWHRNADHLSDLGGWLKSAAKKVGEFVGDYVSPVLNVAKTVLPLFI